MSCLAMDPWPPKRAHGRALEAEGVSSSKLRCSCLTVGLNLEARLRHLWL